MVICWGTESLRFCPKKSFPRGILQVPGQEPYTLAENIEAFRKLVYPKARALTIAEELTRNGGYLQPWEWQLYGWDKN